MSHNSNRPRNARSKKDVVFIPCRHGAIYAVGPKILGAITNVPGMGGRLRKIHGVKVTQDGPNGCNAILPVLRMPEVARVLNRKPHSPNAPAANRSRIW